MRFQNSKFLKTAASLHDFPRLKTPEVALVGRSNVGKSSLLNDLFQKKGLAKTSSTPGKTRLLNFFSIDDKLTFVDLPGYGFAKASFEEKQKWQSLIEVYLQNRDNLKLLLFLLDIRHLPTAADMQMLEWILFRKIPTIVVLTKCDKVNSSEKLEMTKQIVHRIKDLPYVHYSAVKNEGRTGLIAKISSFLYL